MNNINDLEQAIKDFDLKYLKKKSNNIFILENITDDCLTNHKKKYLNLGNDEYPLMVVNGKKSLLAKLAAFTGFVITNKKIHFSLLKRSFFASIYATRIKKDVDLNHVDSFQIGEHDSCYGETYIGHDLMINNQTLGLVRMGYSVMYDEEALEYINGLSQYLFEKGYLTSEPKKFNWQ